MKIKNAKDLARFLGNFMLFVFQQGVGVNRLNKRLK